MNHILQFTGVHTYIDQHHILQGVDGQIQSGRLTVILGRNGAGKSSLLKAVMGLYPVQKGMIHFEKQDIQGQKPFEIARYGIGYVPESDAVFYSLTVEENIQTGIQKQDEDTEKRKENLLQMFPDLKKHWKSKAEILSGGQQQMLAIARVLVNENKLLLIDEPSKGLAPILVDELTEVLIELKKQETIVLVEQNFRMASNCGDDYLILDDGKIRRTGLMEELKNDKVAKQKYLGIGG